MKENYYLALDSGTTGTTAVIFDGAFRQVSRGYTKVKSRYPEKDYVEQDPEELFQSLKTSAGEALGNAGLCGTDIRAVGLANQGETVVLWNKKSGNPVYPAIVWQDKRTADACKKINEKFGDISRERSFLTPDAYFGASKIAWVMGNVPEAKEALKNGDLLAGPTDSWFIWKLTGGKSFYTDCVTASRTGLFNARTLSWDGKLLEIYGVPKNILPEIKNSADNYGETDPSLFCGVSAVISGNTADQQAALTGQGCITENSVKTTYGTGAFMLMNTGDRPVITDNGIITTLSPIINGKPSYALDGGAYIAGAAVSWLTDGLGIIKEPREADILAESTEDNGGVYFVPAFSGLAAPYNDPYARGLLTGITGGTNKAHIARATLEATAYQVADLLCAMEKAAGVKIKTMRADGGSTKSNFLMQFQADVLGIPVEVPEINETTALGTAYLAALGIGDIADLSEILPLWKKKKEFFPQMSGEKRNALLDGWHTAVNRSKSGAASRQKY